MKTINACLVSLVLMTAAFAADQPKDASCEGTVLKYTPNYERMQVQTDDHVEEVTIDLVEIRIEKPVKYEGVLLKVRHDIRARALGKLLADAVGKRVAFSVSSKILEAKQTGTDLPMSYELNEFRALKQDGASK
jgi:hypothetical protein